MEGLISFIVKFVQDFYKSFCMSLLWICSVSLFWGLSFSMGGGGGEAFLFVDYLFVESMYSLIVQCIVGWSHSLDTVCVCCHIRCLLLWLFCKESGLLSGKVHKRIPGVCV